MRIAQKSFSHSALLRAKCITNYIKFKPLPHLTLLCIGYDIVIAAVNFSVWNIKAISHSKQAQAYWSAGRPYTSGKEGRKGGKWCVAKYGDPYSEFVLCI